ncbi:MAG: hypothetical protein PHX30_01730 [Candidatus Pacebacteria bacterium]|jgi:hypothetical protein|nr:hypothetical protein [Candidatus Paceibacterota bacterium]
MDHLPKIICQAIPHKEQSYDTIGDYREENGDWVFSVSQMTTDYEFMVIIHEMVEWYLTQRNGAKDEEIVAFDRKFKEEQSMGQHPDIDEPGDSPDCPYKKEHFFAANIERMIADKLGVDWKEYDSAQSPGSEFRG